MSAAVNPLSPSQFDTGDQRRLSVQESRPGEHPLHQQHPRRPSAPPAHMDDASPLSLQVSFDEEAARALQTDTSNQLQITVPPPRYPVRRTHEDSPLLPSSVFTPRHSLTPGGKLFEIPPDPIDDPSSAAILIYPKKIDDLRRFRLFFVGLLMFILSSTQGVHSLFGTILMQQQYLYDVRQMTIVYVCGSAFGMFVLPFGVLYDWFGPRIGIVITVAITALGQLLFALMFAGHISHSVKNSCLFYAILSWGCYGIDVTVLPAILTHFPRDRGQPTGFLKTFSGLGSSLLSCLFRGFFNGRFDNLMWFIFAFTIVFGAIGAWYIEDAPYIVNRWDQRKLTPRKVLRNHLIRNRYMSQLVPKRRFTIAVVVMVLLNFYLTIQAVVVAFLMDQMTPGKLRGIAIGAILVTLLILIFVVPIREIDGMSRQDKEVIDNAKKKERELMHMKEERRAVTAGAEQPTPADVQTHDHAVHFSSPENGEANGDASPCLASSHADHSRTPTHATVSVEVPPLGFTAISTSMSHEHSAAMSTSLEQSGSRRRRLFPGMGASLMRGPTSPSRQMMELHVEDDDHHPDANFEDENPLSASPRRDLLGRPPLASPRRHSRTPNLSLQASLRSPGRSPRPQLSRPSSGVPRMTASFSATSRRASLSEQPPGEHGLPSLPPPPPPYEPPEEEPTQRLAVTAHDPSTYDHPIIETINVCGEVFVKPVYQTTFLQSLTYIDLWLIAYTTMVVWGVGLSLTANWNIQIMSLARWSGLDYKYYVLFAAMSGVCTAGGRVFVGVYDQLLKVMRDSCGIDVIPTFAYPLASIGLFISMIFWIALPGDKVLVLAYILGPAFYGVSTSFTPYMLGTIFDRQMGTHYGFIFLGSAVGQVLFFYCSWYLTYDNESMPLPIAPGVPIFQRKCIGHRRCMNKAVGIYLALTFSSIISSVIVHYRYARLVEEGLQPRRVIADAVKRRVQQRRKNHQHDPKDDEAKQSASGDEGKVVSEGEMSAATKDAELRTGVPVSLSA